MNRKTPLLIFLGCILLGQQTIHCATQPIKPIIDPSTATTKEIDDFTQKAFALNKQLADTVFNPTDPTQRNNPPDPYPTSSSNETAVDALFKALKVDATIIDHIKKFYFYLEYVVKLELGAKFLRFYENNKLGDSAKLIVAPPSGSQSRTQLVTWAQEQLQKWDNFTKQGKLQANLTQIQAIKNPDWLLFNETVGAALAHLSWKEIGASPFWSSIPIDDRTLIAQSNFWQKYVKYQITAQLLRDQKLIKSLEISEAMVLPYIPTFQTSYYDDDFTQIRQTAELHRTQLALTDNIRDRMLAQSIDWNKLNLTDVWKQAEIFAQTPFFIALSQAAQNPATLMEAITKEGSFLDEYLTKDEQQKLLTQPLIGEELTCLGMIKNLQAITYDMFSQDKLDSTMKALRVTKTRPLPQILLFDTQDYVFIDDLNRVINYFKQSQLAATQPKQLPSDDEVTTQAWGFFKKLWKKTKEEVKEAGKKFDKIGDKLAKEGKTWATDFGDMASDGWKAAKDGVSFLGYEIAYGFTGDKDFQKKAAKAQSQANKEFEKAQKEYEKVWKDTTDITKTAVAEGAGVAVGFAAGETLDNFFNAVGINTNFEKLSVAVWKSATSFVIDGVAQMTHIINTVFEAGIYAAFYAPQVIALMTTSIMGATIEMIGSGFTDFSGWEQLGSQFADLGGSMLTTFLSELKFSADLFINTMKDSMGVASYLAQLLAEVVIDVWKSFAKIAGGIAGDWFGSKSTENWFDESSKTLESYRGTIVAVANTAILVGTTIATDGLSAIGIGMGVAFQAPQVVSSAQKDTRRVKEIKEEKDMVKSFSKYVDDTIVLSEKRKEAMLSEQNAKFLEQIDNQERGLGFMQNFYSTYYESVKENMSEQLGTTLSKNLTPVEQTIKINNADVSYTMTPADVGSMYGFNTNVYNLNPSQGFPLYNKGRDSFSQEIAVNPTMVSKGSKSKPEVRKFWFLQKETMLQDNDIQEFDVRLQPIYLLDEFYLGLYFGGKPIDLKTITATGKADLDAAHQAKMLVFKREKAQNPITVDLYEHEGKGWYKANITTLTCKPGTWYRMNMKLNDTNLQVQVYEDGAVKPTAQTFTVAKTDQKTAGVISSGCACEYQILSPKPNITKISKKLRPESQTTEKLRETADRNRLKQTFQPTLEEGDPFKLQIINKTEGLKGNYIYATQATGISKEIQKLTSDYVVVGEVTGNNIIQTVSEGTEKEKIEHQLIGIDPYEKLVGNSDRRVVISLISDKQFEPDGTWAGELKVDPVAYRPTLNALLQQQTSISDATRNEILAARTTYNTPLLAPTPFGNITLTPANKETINGRLFIYKGTSPNNDMRTNNILDYFVLGQLDTYSYPINFPASAQETSTKLKPTIIISLVTGQYYTKGSSTPLMQGQSALSLSGFDDVLTQAKQYGTLYQDITRAQAAYKNIATLKDLDKQVVQTLKTITADALASTKAQSSKTKPSDQKPSQDPAKKSTTKQQQQAAQPSTSGW